jgi:hypothetical protein
MNRIRIASAVLFLLFATSAFAVQPRPESQSQQQDEPKAKPDKDAAPEKDAKHPKQDDAKPPKQDESKPAKQDKQPKVDAKKDEQSQQAQHSPAGKSGRIPDDKFRANFGRQHTFKIGHPQNVGGRPRFQYGGYSFIIADPWPVGWAYTDDCYVDYIDGEYFIFDVLHPGVQIAITVVT